MTSVSWTNAAKCPDSKTLPYILILNDFDVKILTKINPIAPAKSGVDAKLHI